MLRLWPKQGLMQQTPACSKIPGTEHPCGLSCEPVLLCFQLHQPGFYPPFAEPLAVSELLMMQGVSSAGQLQGCSLFHLS